MFLDERCKAYGIGGKSQVRIRSRRRTHFPKELERRRTEVQNRNIHHDHGAREININEGKPSNPMEMKMILSSKITIISLNEYGG